MEYRAFKVYHPKIQLNFSSYKFNLTRKSGVGRILRYVCLPHINSIYWKTRLLFIPRKFIFGLTWRVNRVSFSEKSDYAKIYKREFSIKD